MKRIPLLLCLLALLGLLSGCGTAPSAGAGEAGFAREDLLLQIEGTAYRCDMDIGEVIGTLGENYGYAEGQSCDYDGLDKTFLYDMAEFYTNPLAQGDTVYEIFTRDPAVTTSKGIAVGAGRGEVLAAHGLDCEDEGDLLIYRLEGERASLCFELEGDRVWAIYLTTLPV